MILTKAYITQLPSVEDNKFKVRVPLMEDTTGTAAIFDALLCASPGIYNGYNVDDCVFVHFEDNNQNTCIILGKLYNGLPTEDSSSVIASDLKIMDNASLPATTRLGTYSVDDFTKLYNSVLVGGDGTSGGGGGGSSYDIEQLKKKVNFTDWVIEQPLIETTSGGTEPGPNLNFYRKYKGIIG